MLSIFSSIVVIEGAEMVTSIGSRMLGIKANKGLMGGIKKLDNFVGRMNGKVPNQQQMPPPVPSQPVQQPQQSNQSVPPQQTQMR